MNKIQTFFTRIPFYILITGIYPVLFLWMVNFIRVPGYVAPRSLLISLVFTAIVFLLSWLVIRPLPRTALVSFVWLVLFFTYGRLFALVDNMQVSGFLAGRHRFFLPLWVGIGILATILILRSKSDYKNATQALNIVLTVLLALTGLQIGFAAARQGLVSHLDAETATNPGEKIETLNFQQMFINTTMARVLVEWLEFNPANSARAPSFVVWLLSPSSLNPDSSPLAGRNYRQYQNHLFQLESLSTIPDIPGRKFTYAHILVTHQPFVFTPTGEFRLEARDDTMGYHDQVLYLNTRLIEIIQNLLSKSSVPPVIILQSDHAYGQGAVKVKNFQAYYFPDNGKAMVYPSMT